jgi:hypothetical protein
MQVGDIRNPTDRNKLILAAGLFVVALVFLWWALIGFGGGSNKVPTRVASQPTPGASPVTTKRPQTPTVADLKETNPDVLRQVVYRPPASAPEAGRNIFAYYEKPVQPVQIPTTPTPTPTPTPPVLLASVSPANVFARTGDFTLEVSGDKITPQLRVVVDNSTDLPTRYINPQQASATIPASLIANPGTRQIMLRSGDGKIYSNTATLSVAAPPTPNYSYIGIIGTVRHIDTAILQDKNNKDTLNVQRGDLIGGRFRVTSISEKEVVVVDSTLKIKHSLAMTTQGDRGNPLQRPTPKVESEDDEP